MQLPRNHGHRCRISLILSTRDLKVIIGPFQIGDQPMKEIVGVGLHKGLEEVKGEKSKIRFRC